VAPLTRSASSVLLGQHSIAAAERHSAAFSASASASERQRHLVVGNSKVPVVHSVSSGRFVGGTPADATDAAPNPYRFLFDVIAADYSLDLASVFVDRSIYESYLRCFSQQLSPLNTHERRRLAQHTSQQKQQAQQHQFDSFPAVTPRRKRRSLNFKLRAFHSKKQVPSASRIRVEPQQPRRASSLNDDSLVAFPSIANESSISSPSLASSTASSSTALSARSESLSTASASPPSSLSYASASSSEDSFESEYAMSSPSSSSLSLSSFVHEQHSSTAILPSAESVVVYSTSVSLNLQVPRGHVDQYARYVQLCSDLTLSSFEPISTRAFEASLQHASNIQTAPLSAGCYESCT
jgi:hypothetical protein